MISITPYIESSKLGEYEDKLVELYRADAALNETIPDSIRSSTEWLLRLVNCFYSNKIEGNPTHPKELLRTQEMGRKPGDDEYIIELLSHLEAQIRAKNSDMDKSNVMTQGFIKELHKSFYKGLPDSFLTVKDKEGQTVFDHDGEPVLVQIPPR